MADDTVSPTVDSRVAIKPHCFNVLEIAGYGCGSPITSYTVSMSPGGRTVSVGGTTLHATFSGLAAGSYFVSGACEECGRFWSVVGVVECGNDFGGEASRLAGVWLLDVGVDGHVYPFGSAASSGSASGPVVAIAPRADGRGCWTVDAAGNLSHFGAAGAHGGSPSLNNGERVSTISATPSGGTAIGCSPIADGRSCMATRTSTATCPPPC
jgi:hypothetical protein